MGLNPQRTRTERGRVNPLSWLVRWADWFESRGVYVPGEDTGILSTWRDFGWLIIGWLIALSAFVVLFAIVS